MKKHLLVSPKIDLIELIGNCLLEKSRELFNNLIVFPAKRPIHFLRKYLAGKLRSSFRSPVILAIDEFVDYLYDLLGYSDVRINSLDAIALLFELNREGGLINYPGGELTIDEFLPWGAKILSDFEEIYIEAIGPEVIRSIDQIESEQLPARIRERLLTFSQLYKSFYDYLIEHHYSTRSLRYRRVAESMEKVDLEKFEQIFLAGFFMLTRSEEKIFKNISQLKNSQLIFQDGPGVDATIRSLNLAVEKIVSGNPQPVVSLYKAMDAHGQVFKLAEVISERKNFNQRDVVVLPVPDTLFPVIQHALGRIKGDYNISLGYPLYRTSIYSLIETLRQLLNTKEGEKYSLAHYLKFVLHPYIKNIRLGKMSEPTRIIFHTIEEFYQNVPRRFITLTEIENNEKLTDLCWNKLRDLFPGGPQKDIIINHLKEIHYHLIKNFENIDSLEDFGNKLLNFLSFISLHSTANRHIYTAPFVETMIGAIYELRQSFLKKVRFSKMESYFRLLRSYIRTLHHPFEGSPVQGLQVLGFLETRNIK
ncbi:MAG: hypothetical protein ABIL05_05190, partial [candidate division WOR-3 bacterium]